MSKLTFVSFQGIVNGIPFSIVKFIIPVLDAFSKSVQSNLIYYVRVNTKSKEGTKIQDIGWFYNKINRFIGLVNKYLLKVPNYKLRYVHERIYDLFISFKIKEATTLISTAYLYKSTKKNKKLGGINIFLAGNPDDFEINKLLIREQKDHNVSFNDAYTYKRRIDFGSKSIFSFDHIITFTSSEYNSFEKRIHSEKLSYCKYDIIPNHTIFPSKLYTKSSEIAFCFVAHPFWLKGLPYLLEAWSLINISGARLRIAGNIDNHMQRFIDSKYSNLKNIEFTGWVDDLNAFLRTSHVCIIPSLLDAGPATVAEAMYCGLPVIVSDGCGSKNLVNDGENGFVVENRNAIDIAEKISWFMNNIDQIDIMGKKARITIDSLADNNHQNNVANHIIDVIDKIKEKGQ